MGLQAPFQLFGLAVFSFSIAILVLWALAKLNTTSISSSDPHIPLFDDEISFLFEDQTLINATGATKQLIKASDPQDCGWDKFHDELGAQFPGLREKFARLPTLQGFVLHSQDGTCRMTARWHDGITRVSLHDPGHQDPDPAAEHIYFGAMQTEIDTLRATSESTPFLVWRQNAQGKISWANNSYLELA